MPPRKPTPCPIPLPRPRRPVSDDSLARAVAALINGYQDFLLQKLESANGAKVAERANPFKVLIDTLLKMDSDEDLAMLIHLKEASETKLGDLLEEVALMLNVEAFGGKKSATNGIDIEFDDPDDGTIYLVACKSGSKWANSSSSARLAQDFKLAAKRLRTSTDASRRRNIEFICGCAYGENSRDKVQDSTYYRVAGKDYWHLISGDPNMLERLLAELHRQLQAVEPVSLEDPA